VRVLCVLANHRIPRKRRGRGAARRAMTARQGIHLPTAANSLRVLLTG
jgi:hypothetical protein